MKNRAELVIARESLTIQIDPASELAQALAAAAMPVVLDSNGVRYIVTREDEFVDYDTDALLQELRQSRGALSGVDIAALLDDLAEQRRQDPSRQAV